MPDFAFLQLVKLELAQYFIVKAHFYANLIQQITQISYAKRSKNLLLDSWKTSAAAAIKNCEQARKTRIFDHVIYDTES